MVKIDLKAKYESGVDYTLENGTKLYLMDWNGEIYTNGFNNGSHTYLGYRPVYKEISEDEFEIIGFEEI